MLDDATGTLFSADSFGGLLPEPAQDASDLPPEALAGGMAPGLLSTPRGRDWSPATDSASCSTTCEELRPTQVLSSHLPAAGEAFLDRFLHVLETLPDADPFVAPDHEAFQQMVAMMTARAGPA